VPAAPSTRGIRGLEDGTNAESFVPFTTSSRLPVVSSLFGEAPETPFSERLLRFHQRVCPSNPGRKQRCRQRRAAWRPIKARIFATPCRLAELRGTRQWARIASPFVCRAVNGDVGLDIVFVPKNSEKNHDRCRPESLRRTMARIPVPFVSRRRRVRTADKRGMVPLTVRRRDPLFAIWLVVPGLTEAYRVRVLSR
jgi:hypothetical protein